MNKRSSSFLFGLVIVVFGLFMLAENLNLGFVQNFNFFSLIGLLWPLLLLMWGYENIQKRNFIMGGILAGLGAHFLLNNLSHISPIFSTLSNVLWPMFFVLLGVYILLTPHKAKRSSKDDFSYKSPAPVKAKFKDFEDDYQIITPKKAPLTSQSNSRSSSYSSSHSKPRNHAAARQNAHHLSVNIHKTVDTAVKEIKSAVSEIKSEFSEVKQGPKPPPMPPIPPMPPMPPMPPNPVKAEQPTDQVSETTSTQEASQTSQAQTEPTSDCNNQRRQAIQHRTYSASFNSKKIKFTEEDFVEGENVIDLSVMFGDMKIGIPRNMDIKLRGQVTLGDINFLGEKFDGISQAIKDDYLSPSPSGKTITINATVVLGDLKIKLV